MLSPFQYQTQHANPSTASASEDSPVLHIRFNGRSFDVLLSDLDVGQLSQEVEVKHALARFLGVGVDRFRDYRIDRHENANMTLRPEAIFG